MAIPYIDPNRRYSSEEYFSLDAISDIRLEYFGGYIYPHPEDALRLMVNDTYDEQAGATKSHNRILRNLAFALENYLWSRDSQREFFTHSVSIEVGNGAGSLYPDLVIPSTESDEDPMAVRFPLFIAEVVTPATTATDRGWKLDAYRSLPTVEQVVVIESRWMGVESYTRNADGRTWTLTSLREPVDELVIKTLDAPVSLAHLYRNVTLSPTRPWEAPPYGTAFD